MKKQILLIEDHRAHSDFFKRVASSLDCEVHVVKDVRSLRKVWKATPFGDWDLVVLDCQLPEKPGGVPSTGHLEQIHELISPYIQNGALWIWSVYDDDREVLDFLQAHSLLKFTIPKTVFNDRLRLKLIKVLQLNPSAKRSRRK